jgi:DNA repair protein RecO (recombination protein O)
MIQRQSEAIVLRAWPFHESDVMVSLLTREQGKVKGVARAAMKSRRRFGGALEPMTHVRANYVEKPKQDVVRLDSFEILRSPLSNAMDHTRLAGLQFIAEVLDEAMPEQGPDDAIFRLTLAVMERVQVGRVWMPVTYFALWVTRLMGWMPDLGVCAVGGEALGGGAAYYEATSDGVTCSRHMRTGATAISGESLALAERIFRQPISAFAEEPWPRSRAMDLRRFAMEALERHLEHRLRAARALARGA